MEIEDETVGLTDSEVGPPVDATEVAEDVETDEGWDVVVIVIVTAADVLVVEAELVETTDEVDIGELVEEELLVLSTVLELGVVISEDLTGPVY